MKAILGDRLKLNEDEKTVLKNITPKEFDRLFSDVLTYQLLHYAIIFGVLILLNVLSYLLPDELQRMAITTTGIVVIILFTQFAIEYIAFNYAEHHHKYNNYHRKLVAKLMIKRLSKRTN